MTTNSVQGIGNDIIEVERIRSSIAQFGDTFLNRLFTPKEQDYCNSHSKPEIRFAGRFAAKEAIAKALGTGFGEELAWLDLEIINSENGKPVVYFSQSFQKKGKKPAVELSISHCNSYATAVAITF